MISLLLDTSVSRLIIGIYRDKKEIYFENELSNNDLSGKVLLHLKNALDKLKLKVNDIGEIYIVNGPGSFTGTRIGVTIAKVLASSLNIKIYPISELQLMASGGEKKYTLSLIDARRGYVYAGMYNKNLKNIIKDQYIKYDELIKLLKKDYELDDILMVSYDDLSNVEVPILNIEKLLSKLKVKNIDANSVVPNYIKKTEAEEKLNDSKN